MANQKIIDDGKGGKLLEITESRTVHQEDLQQQKQAIATWREEENTRHTRRLDELDAREAEIDGKLAMFQLPVSQ